MSERKSYRDIFKATTLMGSVQVVQIIIRIIRMKIVSVLLGSAGMGINALFQNNINLIGGITNLGLNVSAVRDLSYSNNNEDKHKLARVAKSLRSWIWGTGLFGSVVMLSLAPQLSKLSFGSSDYTWGFIWLSCVILFKTLAEGENSIMRGMQRLKLMAKSATIGATLGLIISLPLYWLFGVKGIVPALIISAIVTYFIERYFSHKIKFEKVKMTCSEQFEQGKGMAKLGIILVLSSFISTLVVYITNIFISNYGSISDVGLYQAGVSLSNQYVGMIFTAMSADYLPRLSSVSSDNLQVKQAVNQQAEIALLIIAPIAIAIMLTTPFVIRILYTKEFTPIIGYVQWSALGVLFKACSWTMAFAIIAKGASKLFLTTELISNAIILILTIGGYYFGGLTGAGVAYCISYLVYTIIIYGVTHKKYQFAFSKDYYKVFGIQVVLVAVALMVTLIYGYPIAYISNSILLIISGLFSLRELNKRISIMTFLKNRKNKRKK